MATTLPATPTTNGPRAKFGMYRQHLSERPRLLKHVLVSSASDIPDDNQFKSRKAKHVRRSICFEVPPGSSAVAAGSAGMAVPSAKKGNDTVRDALEQEFMERFIGIEGAPEELKFPVLRASHPGGRVFRTQALGTLNRGHPHQRHPFNLTDPNAPPPEYSCYYDKHLKHFFHKPSIIKKLIEQGVITEDHYIREPYKAFKEYIRRKKLPHGTNPITQNPSPEPPKSPAKLKSIFADDQIKEFVESKFNVDSAIVDELYSGRRKGSVIPLKDSLQEDRRSTTPPHLPALRSSTPQKLAAMELDLQQSLHHSRINVVVAKRQMIAQTKKSNAMHQGIVKQQKHNDNKRQMEIERWEASLDKLRTTFDRKKNSIFKRLKDIEEDKQQKNEQKRAEADKLKKKFAGIFIKKSIAERKIRENRQTKEKASRARNNAWLEEQKRKREKHLLEVNAGLHEKQVGHMAEITSHKTSKIAQLQLKCEYYDQCSGDIFQENVMLEGKIRNLQKIQKSIDKDS